MLFHRHVTEARRHEDLYFAALLEENLIHEAMGDASSVCHSWLYTRAITCWVFLTQCFSSDHSCRDSVARLNAWRVSQGLKPCSPQTGGYCRARDTLPEEGCRELVRRTGKLPEAEQQWLWHGRRVKLVDGATVTMPDTPENQAAYPQHKEQQPGCGFPIARLVVLFSLAVGTVLEAAISKCEGKLTGENSLFRSLHDTLEPGEILLADRYYSGWFDMALLRQRGVDFVLRKHQARANDFRCGKRLGTEDHVVRVNKPPRPAWMSAEQYATMPEFLEIREVRVRVAQRGFRTKSFVIVTSLLDAEQFTAKELADLYRRRWEAELNLRSLKQTLQMDHLRCKTPHRVRNEISMHLVAYNLIRGVMARAARAVSVSPWEISFKGALQTLNHFFPLLASGMPFDQYTRLLARCVAAHRVGDRPDRFEPRLVKRRPKPYKLLQEHRNVYKARMK
jgi:hypothetical protein